MITLVDFTMGGVHDEYQCTISLFSSSGNGKVLI